MVIRTMSIVYLPVLLAAVTLAAAHGEDATPKTPEHADANTVWLPNDGVIKVEAERYAPKSNWSVKQTPKGHSGSGYLMWEGEFQHGETEGAHPADKPLGSEEDQITIRYEIKEPGMYRIDLKNFHVREDGDNDVWLRNPESDETWHKVGSQQENEYDFLHWTYRSGNPTKLEKGIHTAQITGRSPGFGVDYIAIYRCDEQTESQRISDEDRKRVESAPESNAYTPQR